MPGETAEKGRRVVPRLGPLFASVCLAAALTAAPAAGQQPPANPGFEIELDVVHRELRPDWCWFHPRAAAIPGRGRDGGPAVILTLQRHLVADDHYSGLYAMRSDDLGRTWTEPVL